MQGGSDQRISLGTYARISTALGFPSPPSLTRAWESLFDPSKFSAGLSCEYIGEGYGRQPTIGRGRCWILMR